MTSVEELERAAQLLATLAVRWEEFAAEAARPWPAWAWSGRAYDAYAARVAATGRQARAAARRWRQVAEQLWVLEGLVRDGVLGQEQASAVVAGWGGGVRPDALSTKPVLHPVAARDMAQRAALAADLVAGRTRDRDGLLGPDEAQAWRNARAVDAAIDGGGDGRGEGEERVLWAYDLTAHGGDGTVVVGVGDVGAAEDHVVLVPGVGTEVVDAARQVERVAAVVDAAHAQGSPGAAGWFWLGYDTPEGPLDPAVRTVDRAVEGGSALADDVEELRREAPAADWTVVGHSFGSTTVAAAAAGPGLDVDAVVLVGSPGAGPAQHADGLGVGSVFVGRDSRDAVALLGDEGWVGKGGVGLGRDPAAEEFGAVRFRAERPDREPWPGLGEAHTGYFTPGGESLGNVGAVVAGAYDRVEVAAPARDPWWGRPRDPEWRREVG